MRGAHGRGSDAWRSISHLIVLGPGVVRRHSLFPHFYRASIRVDPQDSHNEEQGQGVLSVGGLGAARMRRQTPHGRRRIVAITRTSRVPSRAFLAHRGAVCGAVALDVR